MDAEPSRRGAIIQPGNEAQAEEGATQRSQSEIEGSSSSPNWVQGMSSVELHGVWYHPRQGF